MQFGQLKRREFVTLLGSVAAVWPMAARAQQPAMPVVGVLSIAKPGMIRSPPFEHSLAAFRNGLSERGYIEGRNVSIEYEYAAGRYDRVPALAADLVARKVNVIVAIGTDLVLAAKAATSTIPILFSVGGDPIASGLVESFNRPGGNLTGYTLITRDLAAKRLEMLRVAVPNAAVVALLANPSNPYTETEANELRDAAHSLGVQLNIVLVSSEGDFVSAFASAVREGAEALIMSADPLLLSRNEQLVALAVSYRLPAIYAYREYVLAGGLMSYGASLVDQWRTLGNYAGRILKGERPADLPVFQPTRFELLFNLKTAKALGLTVPPMLLARADEVIE